MSSVFDTYGVNGDGETWDYTDGFATRIGVGIGAFNQANYSTSVGAFDTLTEAQQVEVFVAAEFTAVPEPSSVAFLALGASGIFRRRR